MTFISGRETNAIDSLFARYDGSSVAWYLRDNLGSTRQIVNTSGGNLDSVTYGDSFGNNPVDNPQGAGDRFKFTGREFDAEISLYYYRARYYDQGVGRFVSQDPIRFAAKDPNLYRYVSNTPTTKRDPSGKWSWSGCAGGAISGGAVGGAIGTLGSPVGTLIGGGLGLISGCVGGGIGADYIDPPASSQGTHFETGLALGVPIGIVCGLIGWGGGWLLASTPPPPPPPTPGPIVEGIIDTIVDSDTIWTWEQPPPWFIDPTLP